MLLLSTLFLASIFLAESVKGEPYAKEVMQALEDVAWDEESLAQLPSLTFISGESKTVSGGPVTNRVHLQSIGAFDVWQMRQRSTGEGPEVTSWSSVAIVVDKRKRPYQAFYFEFKPSYIHKGKLPATIPHRADCSRCHASGPRAIRPNGPTPVMQWTTKDADLLKQWNQKIAAYGVVQDILPATSRNQQYLSFSFCADCHNSNGFIRGDLGKHHADSILYLLRHGPDRHGFLKPAGSVVAPAMPLGAHKLSHLEQRCLVDWLSDKNPPQKCYEAESKATASRASLEAKVNTNLGSFAVHNIFPRAYLKCSTGKWNCALFAVATLEKVTTGNVLRDKHMRKLFEFDRNRQLMFRAKDLPLPLLTEKLIEVATTGELIFGGKSSEVSVAMKCAAAGSQDWLHCTDLNIDWDMRTHGLSPPRFMAVSVNPRITVKGKIKIKVWREE